MECRVLVRGSGDIGSVVAHCLFQAGYAVAIHDTPQPTATRRKMAFTDAVFAGYAWLEGVEARRVDNFMHLLELLTARQVIPVIVLDLNLVLEAMSPDVLIDARIDPREPNAVVTGIGERPGQIAEGILQAIRKAKQSGQVCQ